MTRSALAVSLAGWHDSLELARRAPGGRFACALQLLILEKLDPAAGLRAHGPAGTEAARAAALFALGRPVDIVARRRRAALGLPGEALMLAIRACFALCAVSERKGGGGGEREERKIRGEIREYDFFFFLKKKKASEPGWPGLL
mgnify:CR=1 FL=1